MGLTRFGRQGEDHGIWGDPQATGKPVCSDLRSAKKTLPVTAALAAGTAASHQLATMYLRRAPLTDAEVMRAAVLIEQAGGRAWAQDEADRHLHAALTCVNAANPDPIVAEHLTTLAHLITRRDH